MKGFTLIKFKINGKKKNIFGVIFDELLLKNYSMKKLILICSLALFATGCVQDKEKRDQRKADHSAEHMRNEGVDSAASTSDKKADTVAVEPPKR